MAEQLICFLHDGWRPRIVPATPKREWMDQTPESFAYRCLPLAIANAHGWVVLSACGFQARWTGGSEIEDVEIRLDEGTLHGEAPVSIFGQGVLSFHVAGILRTSPGINLYVTGPPNEPIDGLSPLTGIIETDWSPYTFTMNWRFTRANHWVRFEEGQAFAFFFPIDRHRLETTEPEFRALDSDAKFARDFAAWDHSRREFQQRMRDDQPRNPAGKWQKRYYRGRYPDGDRKHDDHHSKLRVPAFTDEQTLSGSECPRHRAAAAPSPNTAGDTRLLARRDWLLRVQEQQQRLASDGGGLLRIEPPSQVEFQDELYAPGRPAIIAELASDWPARALTPAALSGQHGDIKVEVQSGRSSNARYEREKERHRSLMTLAEFLDRTAVEANNLYLTALNNSANQDLANVLRQGTRPLDTYLTPDGAGMPWMGGAGTFTPLHHDLTNNLLVQIVGRKQIVLLPPSETCKLAAVEGVFSDVVDLDDPACIARHPEAASAQGYRLTLEPGDGLFIPVGWWHQVRSLEFAISLTYTNFHWPNDASQSWPG